MKYVVLNKAYSLRNEKTCSFIVRKSLYIDSEIDNYRTIYPIPPFLGYIFSNIGRKEIAQSLSLISERLNISISILRHFIGQLVEKPSQSLSFQGEKFFFPEHLLLYSSKKDTNYYHTVRNFNPMVAYKPCRPYIPLTINYMVTEKCNTNCVYCYAKRDMKQEMSTLEIIQVLHELSEAGVINLTLTGGDIFARKDWADIISETQKAGFGYLISTKTILEEGDILELKKLRISKIQFSLDSISGNILHEMIKVSDDYVDRLKLMFRYCTLHEISISLRTVLCKQNATIEEVKKLCDFIDTNSCIKSWVITPAFYSENKKDYSNYAISNEMLIKVFSYLQKRKMRIRPLFNKINIDGYKLQRASTVFNFIETNQKCYANIYSMSILPSGVCTICEMLYYNQDFILGNIKKQKLKDIWNSDKAFKLFLPNQSEVTRTSACSSCLVFDKCKRELAKNVCYVDIMKVHNDLDFPDPRCPQSMECGYIL